jgi:hypothetical protein
MWLEDISRDGKVLVNLEDARCEIAVLPPDHQSERALPWSGSNVNDLVAITDDGGQLLVTAYQNERAVTYLRPTDGSSPLKLGRGRALAFSPDEKWVLAADADDPSVLWLLPIGVGVPKKLPLAGLNFGLAQWLKDGKRIVSVAQRKGETRWQTGARPSHLPAWEGKPQRSDGPRTVISGWPTRREHRASFQNTSFFTTSQATVS